jgi:hypothetical protein
MKKEKKGKTGLIVLLIIIILGLVGYICYDKGIIKFNNTNNQESNNTTTETETDIALDDSRFINVYNNLHTFFAYKSRENGVNSFSDEDKVYVVRYYIRKNLQNSDIVKTSEKSSDYGYYYSLKGSYATDAIKLLFGSNCQFDKNSLVKASYRIVVETPYVGDGGTVVIDSYDSVTDLYKIHFESGIDLEPVYNGYFPKIISNSIVSAKLKGDIITVIEKAVFIDTKIDGNNCTYLIYKDSAKTNLIDTKVFDSTNADNVNTTISAADYTDTSVITSTYKLDTTTNLYYFIGASIK